MMGGHGVPENVSAPEPFVVPQGLKTVCYALIALGVIGLVVGLLTDPMATQIGWLSGFWLTTAFALLSAFFVAVGYASYAMWNVTLRRIPEAMMGWLPIGAVTGAITVGFAFLEHSIFHHWTHPEGPHAAVVLKKGWWLNTNRFVIFYVITMALLVYLVAKLRRHSYTQDQDGDVEHSWKLQSLGPVFLIVFSLGFSGLAVDFLMSLQPSWFSTMWGVYIFAGAWQATNAMICLTAVLLVERGYLDKVWVNENHIHDVAKFMFAFTVFYGYIAFCQFLLIWYANLPEETIFYHDRYLNGWAIWTWVLVFGKFIIPFAVLLRHGIKRMGYGLKAACVWVVCAQIFELWWLVAPAAKVGSAHPGPGIPFVEISIMLGFFGAFILVSARALSKHSLIPVKDPRLHEVIAHHQI
ncbi:MAG: hypothetical protein VX405_00665 [Myxococcota bacterium]|nr:hypothetical protein [Myxococcota bacterium]